MLNYSTFSRETSHVKIALYGESGTGKTRFCSTAKNWLFLSSEEKFASIQLPSFTYIKVSTITDLVNTITEICHDASIPDDTTLCIDSFSDIAERTLRSLPKAKDARLNYMDTQTQCEDFMRLLPQIPFDMIIVFKAKVVTDTENFRKYYPSLPSESSSRLVPYFFDYVFATRTRKSEDGQGVQYYILTQNEGQYMAKDCSGILRAYETPDAAYIFDQIKAPVSYENSEITY